MVRTPRVVPRGKQRHWMQETTKQKRWLRRAASRRPEAIMRAPRSQLPRTTVPPMAMKNQPVHWASVGMGWLPAVPGNRPVTMAMPMPTWMMGRVPNRAMTPPRM